MRFTRIISLIVALAIIVSVPISLARADVPAAIPQEKAGGTITIKVIDAQGAAVAGAKVALMLPRRHEKKQNTAAGAKGNRPKPDIIARGETGADGTFVFTGISAGTYVAIAGLKGKGIGHERVTVAQAPSEKTLTLKPRERK
jgi:hypothetical protein